MHLAGACILIVGAGRRGAGRRFRAEVQRVRKFSLPNRTPEKAQTLARQAKVKAVKRSDLAKLAFDVIINATPGRDGQQQAVAAWKRRN